jgi:RNA polymerase subunit RPABC4/transcription elongation factor Spt4
MTVKVCKMCLERIVEENSDYCKECEEILKEQYIGK